MGKWFSSMLLHLWQLIQQTVIGTSTKPNLDEPSYFFIGVFCSFLWNVLDIWPGLHILDSFVKVQTVTLGENSCHFLTTTSSNISQDTLMLWILDCHICSEFFCCQGIQRAELSNPSNSRFGIMADCTLTMTCFMWSKWQRLDLNAEPKIANIWYQSPSLADNWWQVQQDLDSFSNQEEQAGRWAEWQIILEFWHTRISPECSKIH